MLWSCGGISDAYIETSREIFDMKITLGRKSLKINDEIEIEEHDGKG